MVKKISTYSKLFAELPRLIIRIANVYTYSIDSTDMPEGKLYMIKNKNHDIITDFITSNREAAYRQAYSYVHNKEDALDIVQTAICKALSSAKSLDNPEYLKSWFYRIVINTALDYLRERKKYQYMDDESLESVVPFSNDSYQDLDLKNAIERLSTDNKTIIILRFYEDMKLDEIASITNENISTVKSRLYSTLRKLRIDLDESANQ